MKQQRQQKPSWTLISLYLTLAVLHGPSSELSGLPHNTATHSQTMGFLMVQMAKNSPAVQKTQVRSMGQEDPLQKGMATHSSFPAWRIPGTEVPGRLQSMGTWRIRHNWVTSSSTSLRPQHLPHLFFPTATLDTELKNLRVVRVKHYLKSILNSSHLKK